MQRTSVAVTMLGLIALLGVAAQTAAIAVTYDVGADFSATSNPTGVWSYGWESELGSSLTLYISQGYFAPDIAYWNDDLGSYVPAVLHNFASTAESFRNLTLQGGQTAFSPGPQDQYSVFRFTAPASGSYVLNTSFFPVTTDGPTTDVHILKNNTQIFGGTLDGPTSPTVTDQETVSLNAGDTIDYAVGYGTDDYFNDGTGISATLTNDSIPVAPTGLSATATGGGAPVALEWTASAGATGYNIYRGTVQIGSTDTTVAWNDAAVVPAGVNVSYTVTAVNAAGTSPSSNTATVLLKPAAPLNLTATAGTSAVTLNWTASPGATVYRVYRGTTANGEASPAHAGGIAATSYTDTSVTDGARYFYKVTAANSAGASGFSNEASATPVPLIPPAPANLTATAAAGGVAPVTLAWTASPGATGYDVHRGTSQIGSASANSTFSDSTVVPAGIGVSYTVTAVNAGGTSPASNTATVLLAPAPPTNLTATATDNSVTLNWTASAGTIVYRVYRGTTSGGEGNLAIKGAIGTTSYTDTTAANGPSYYYTVTAVNTAGASPFFNEVGPVTPGAPSAPTLLSATAAAGGVAPVTLNWTSSTGALVYRVYRATISNGEGSVALKGGIGTTTFADTAVIAGSTYFYKVTAVNVGGASSFSNEESATLTPSAPTGLTATAAAGGIAPVTLAWAASSGATGYDVFRGTTQVGSTGTSPGFPDTSVVVAGIDVTYSVTAVNAGGTSAASNTATVLLAPIAPSDLTATAADNAVTLNWTASAGALVYRVYRGTTAGGEGTAAIKGGIGTATFTDTTAANGPSYYYKVTAVNAAGASGFSNEAGPDTPGVPNAPTLLSATAASGGVAPITLNWTASVGALVYRVYRGTTSSGEGALPIKGGIGTTTFADTAVTAGATYFYKVTAVNVGGASPFSNELSATLAPDAPTGLAATAASGGIAPVTLAWTASPGATGYDVFHGSTLVGSTGTAAFTDSSVVAAGVVVTYTVTAVNAGGTSSASNTATVPLAPAPPLNLIATSGNNEIALNWSAGAGALVYRVYRSTVSGAEGNPTIKGGVTTTTFTDTTTVNGTEYYYTVTAVNTAGASAFSNEAAAEAGTTVTATAAPGGLPPITVAWPASVGATVYRVYRSTVSNGEGDPALAAGITVTKYTDSAVTPGNTYYYKITAVNSAGASPFSPEAYAILTPAPIVDLSATPSAGPTAVSLSWDPSNGATSYNVYRSAVSGLETLYATTSGPSYTDSSVDTTTTYFYYVEAVNAGGTSERSNEARVLTTAQAIHQSISAPCPGSQRTAYGGTRSLRAAGVAPSMYQIVQGIPATFDFAASTSHKEIPWLPWTTDGHAGAAPATA